MKEGEREEMKEERKEVKEEKRVSGSTEFVGPVTVTSIYTSSTCLFPPAHSFYRHDSDQILFIWMMMKYSTHTMTGISA